MSKPIKLENMSEKEKINIIRNFEEKIEQQQSEIEFMEIANHELEKGFSLMKKFLKIYFDKTYPGEKIDIINNSDKITYEEIVKVFQLLEIDCEVV